jgi:beta-carotene hydroxylase
MSMATATGAATTPTAAPRDQPNALADRKALGLVKPYLGMVAWPTVFLAIGIVAAFALITALATMGVIPLWLGMIFNSLILYADQTPLHEACHGNIAGKDSKWLWMNHLVGYVCGALLLHEYKAFRYMHLAHHRDTNNPDIDPDHWVAVENPFAAPPSCSGTTSISGNTSPSTRTFRACGRSQSTSPPCTRSCTRSPWGCRCSAGGARC